MLCLSKSAMRSSTRLIFTRMLSSSAPSRDDVLISALSQQKDIVIRVTSCRELLQENMVKNEMSPSTAQQYAQLTVATVMIGVGMKDGETLQIGIVGTNPDGLLSLMCITEGDGKVRGAVGNPSYSGESSAITDIFGDTGSVQVVRSHPSYKHPVTGFVQLQDADIASNLQNYMATSEQRSVALLTDVGVQGSLCRHALGIMMEQLPNADEDSVNLALNNLEVIRTRGLRSYLDGSGIEASLSAIVDQALSGLEDTDAKNRWNVSPEYKCNCSMDKIWRTLRLLPLDEVEDIVAKHPHSSVEIKCEFCGNLYNVSVKEISADILGVEKE